MKIIMKNIILRNMRNRTNTMTIIMKKPQRFITMRLLITMMST